MAVIDSLEFARTGQALSGSLPLAEMLRLKDSLHAAVGAVQYEIQGGHDARRRPVLTLTIKGTLPLRCQRCLEAMEYPLALVNTLRLVAGDAGDEADEETDEIEASATLDVAALVEDELLLSLPYAPRHDEARCKAGGGEPSRQGSVQAFAQLAALKRNRD